MALTVDATLNTKPARAALLEDVLGELTNVGMRDWMAAVRRWHDGALSLIHLNVLLLVSAAGHFTMSQLADELDVSVASVTGIVDRMEKRGIVERRRSATDRRVIEVHVTDDGKKLLQDIGAARRERLGQMIDSMADDELAAMLTGLRAFRAARERVFPGSAK